MKIRTDFWMKPIPIRTMDWQAVTDDYDPGEPDEDGTYHGGGPIGYGSTEVEAIADLMALLGDV